MNVLRIALFGIASSLVALALLFSIICVATDSWTAYDYGSFKGNTGLWKSCVTISGDSRCIKFDGNLAKCVSYLYSCCHFVYLLHE